MQIVMQVQREEQAEKREISKASTSKSTLLDYDRNTDPEVRDAKKKEYLKENKSSFDSLIADVKRRREAAKKKKDDKDLISPTSQTLSQRTTETLSQPTSEASSQPTNETSSDAETSISVVLNIPRSSSVSEKMSRVQLDSPAPSKKAAISSPKLYVTPKRKHSSDMEESSKKFKQNSIAKAMEETRQRVSTAKKTECPVCSQLVPNIHINAHLDRCLNVGSEFKGRKTRKDAENSKKKEEEEEDIFDDDDDEEEEEFDSDDETILSQESVKPREKLERDAKLNVTHIVDDETVEEEEEKENSDESGEKVSMDEEKKKSKEKPQPQKKSRRLAEKQKLSQ